VKALGQWQPIIKAPNHVFNSRLPMTKHDVAPVVMKYSPYDHIKAVSYIRPS
jgi:hypothetical protein